jgi:sulfide:quinone oxidoreductase
MERFSKVVIAGGGFAALEAVLALQSLADKRPHVTLISPEPVFSYRPAATASAFADGAPRSYDLQAIADDLGITLHRRVRLESVGAKSKYVRLSSGARLSYDHLVLAVGARATAAISGALTFRDQRDVPLFRQLLRHVLAGEARRLVFALPSGASWPVPLYELALLSATRAREDGVDVDVTLVSPERAPLAVFGAEASALVAGLLRERGVRFVGSAAASAVRRDGSLALDGADRVKADRVVAAPQLRGQSITGVPASRWGFVATDRHGGVERLPDVYAAGDMTTFPIKQAGLAAQQADRIAYRIASSLGVAAPSPERPVMLQARLLGGAEPLFLRAELDAGGNPIGATLASPDLTRGGLDSKVLAQFLTPYLSSHQPPAGAPLLAA